ncbi:MAG: SGNH/GDSL hydrolase family protein [Planctomycetes bacterium]|nr:SGNH/GDSL hydrolase family protein [Planctomycetota bacterium]
MAASAPEDRPHRPRLSLRRRVAFGAFTCAALLSGFELALSLANFNYASTPRAMKQHAVDGYIALQNRVDELQAFEPHPRRMWTPKPGVGEVNARGLLGPEVPLARQPGKRRVLFLGDSCVQSSELHFPPKVAALARRDGVELEVVIAASGGYSTWQGLDLFREVLAYAPDAVVAYYGWNDHWISAQPDHVFVPPGAWAARARDALSWSRTYQLLQRVVHPPPTPQLPRDLDRLVELTRVPPAHYRANLLAMIALARDLGASAHFVVAPLGPHIAERERTLLGPGTNVPPVHARYQAVLRETAQGEGVHLIDFADVTFDRTLMFEDGVHPNDRGHDLVAARVYASLNAAGVFAQR